MKKLCSISAYLLVGIVLIGCGADERDAEELTREARELINGNDPRTAEILLKQAIQQNPAYSPARVTLARMYLLQGQSASAVKEFEKALEGGYSARDVAVDHMRALIDARRYEDALKVGDQFPADDWPDLLAARGDAFAYSTRTEDAGAAYGLALDADPENGAALVGMARVDYFANRRDEAASKLERISRSDRWVDYERHLLLGRLAIHSGQFESAAESFSDAIELRQFVVAPYIGLFEAYLRDGRVEDAGGVIRTLEERFPDVPAVLPLKAYLHYEQGDIAKTRDLLRAYAGKHRLNDRAKLLLATAHFRMGEYEQAEEWLVNALATASEGLSEQVRTLLATIQLSAGRPRDALATLEPHIENAATNSGLASILASIHVALGDIPRGLELIDQSLETAGESAILRSQKGAAKLITAEYDDAIGELESAIAADSEFAGAELMLVYTLLRAGRAEEAVERAKKAIARYPGNASFPNSLAGIYITLNKTTEAIETLEKALKIVPNDAISMSNLAALKMRAEDVEGAERWYRRLLEIDPNHVGALTAVAGFESEDGNFSKMIELLERARGHSSTATRARALLADYYLTTQQYALARNVADELLSIAAESPIALAVKVKLDLVEGNGESALRSAKRLIAVAPNTADAHFLLGQTLEHNGQLAKARSAFEQALRIDSMHIMASYRLAVHEQRDGDLAGALKRSEYLQQSPETRSAGLRLQAILLNSAGRYADAIAPLEELLDTSTRESDHIMLRQVLIRDGKRDRADQLSAEWVERHTQHVGVITALAESALVGGANERAFVLYERGLKLVPESARLANSVAWTAYKTGKLDRALEAGSLAVSLDPEEGQYHDTYGWALLQSGQTEQALSHLKTAAELQPNDGAIRYRLAVAMQRGGSDKSEVLGELRQSIAADHNQERAAAERLLERLGAEAR